MTTVDVSGIAANVEKGIEAAMKIEPTVASMAGMFVPGAAPIVAMVQPWIVFAAPYLERALNDVASNNGGDVMSAVIEVLQHVTKGMPNSSALTPSA